MSFKKKRNIFMNNYLKMGDVIEIKKGMQIYVTIPVKFVCSNTIGDNLVNTEITVSEARHYKPLSIKEIGSKVSGVLAWYGCKADEERLISFIQSENIGINNEETFDTSIFIGEYLVYKTEMNGGSETQGYPDGWCVYARKIDNPAVKINFYQSGCFTAVIPPDSIKPIRHEKTITIEC